MNEYKKVHLFGDNCGLMNVRKFIFLKFIYISFFF